MNKVDEEVDKKKWTKNEAYRYELETVAKTQTHMLHFSEHCCSMSFVVFVLVKNIFNALSLKYIIYIDGYVEDL